MPFTSRVIRLAESDQTGYIHIVTECAHIDAEIIECRIEAVGIHWYRPDAQRLFPHHQELSEEYHTTIRMIMFPRSAFATLSEFLGRWVENPSPLDISLVDVPNVQGLRVDIAAYSGRPPDHSARIGLIYEGSMSCRLIQPIFAYSVRKAIDTIELVVAEFDDLVATRNNEDSAP